MLLDLLKPIYHQMRSKLSPSPGRVGEGTVLTAGYGADVRLGPREGRISIGRNCVLGCHIILEREEGNVSIGDNTFISSGSQIICAQQITIGSDVMIAWGCTLVDHNAHSLIWEHRAGDVRAWREGLLRGIQRAAATKDWTHVRKAPVHIGNKAWLGFNVTILKGVIVGEGAIVGAGSVVTHDIPAWTFAAGNPAQIVRRVIDDND